MDENVIVISFSEDSRAYEALARLKELAAEDQIDLHDGAVVERAQDGTLHLRDEAGNEDDGLATLTGGTIGLLIGPAPVDGAMAALDGRVTRYARKDVEAEIGGAQEAAHKARVKARKELRRQRREATDEKVRAKLRELRERLRHLVHH
jgi:hypothetical protein